MNGCIDRYFETQGVHKQDYPEYWEQPDVVLNDTTHISVEPKTDPMVAEMYRFSQLWGFPDNANILDWGCGGGRVLLIWYYAKERYETHWTLHGVDWSRSALDIAAKRLMNRAHLSTDLSPDCPKFNLIYTQTALQHNSGWRKKTIYPELHKALAEGGLLCLLGEKTYESPEIRDVLGTYCFDYFDSRAGGGSACWWIYTICSFGFELLNYTHSNYLFRKC